MILAGEGSISAVSGDSDPGIDAAFTKGNALTQRSANGSLPLAPMSCRTGSAGHAMQIPVLERSGCKDLQFHREGAAAGRTLAGSRSAKTGSTILPQLPISYAVPDSHRRILSC